MKPKVYLAGGLRSNWQKKVVKLFPDQFIFFNPRMHNLEENASFYTAWDLHHVKESDIIFAYMEEGNPSGLGLSLEIGYAKALSKTIILVDEKSSIDENFNRRFLIVKESATICAESFEKGLELLASFAIQKKASQGLVRTTVSKLKRSVTE